MTENEISNKIIGFAIEIHKSLGPGLLESAYKECLFDKLIRAGYWVEKEKPMPMRYNNITLDCAYRIDLLVEHKVVIEVKSVEMLRDVHFSQTLTYLRLGDYKLGLLINFNVSQLKEGIRRVANGL